jgi:hypothetical protein
MANKGRRSELVEGRWGFSIENSNDISRWDYYHENVMAKPKHRIGDSAHHARISKNSRNLFIGTAILFTLFVIMVKFNVYQAKFLAGKPYPEITGGKWITAPLKPEETGGRVIFTFFYKSGVEVSETLLSWTIELQDRYKEYGLVTVLIAVPSAEGLPDIMDGSGIYAVVDEDGSNRKNFRNASFATWYVSDRTGIVRVVGSAEDSKEFLDEALRNYLN